jgi:hypothetical protein
VLHTRYVSHTQQHSMLTWVAAPIDTRSIPGPEPSGLTPRYTRVLSTSPPPASAKQQEQECIGGGSSSSSGLSSTVLGHKVWAWLSTVPPAPPGQDQLLTCEHLDHAEVHHHTQLNGCTRRRGPLQPPTHSPAGKQRGRVPAQYSTFSRGRLAPLWVAKLADKCLLGCNC